MAELGFRDGTFIKMLGSKAADMPPAIFQRDVLDKCTKGVLFIDEA